MSTYRATKFDSAAHEVIAVLASVSEGYGSEETGDVDSPVGFIALVHLDDSENQCDGTGEHTGHGPQAHSCDLDVTDTTGAYPVGDEAGEVAREYGVTADDIRGHHLVTHDSQGFVSVETFATREAADNEYACRAARFGEWSEAQEAMETDPEDDGYRCYVCPVTGHGYHEV